jgi:poly(3-hydroxybutyrate) depolymerase
MKRSVVLKHASSSSLDINVVKLEVKMKYTIFDTLYQQSKPVVSLLNKMNTLVTSELNPLADSSIGRFQSAMLQTSVRLLDHYPKQDWEFDDIDLDGKKYAINSTVELKKPFANLMKFTHDGLAKDAPKVLFVSALSGHHATLSADTFYEFFPDHQVFACDWLDGKQVPLSEGRFGLEEYIEYVIEFLKHLGENVHVIGLCQAGPAALVAAAVLSEQQDPAKPASLTLMASPMDIRINPGKINEVMKLVTAETWGTFAVQTVPNDYPGAGRKVYPGMMQLANFMGANIKNHITAHLEFAKSVYHGDMEAADKHREFYDEYFAILDMPEEFCLETLDQVFIKHNVANNAFVFQGKQVDFKNIVDIPLLAMEGKNDDMVRLGQCNAVVDICSELPDALKEKYVQEGVGHYGIFNGSTFRKKVAPKVKGFIQSSSLSKTIN